MIFEGSCCNALILDQLSKNTVLENWQLKQGTFSNLEIKDRSFKNLDSERAVLDENIFQVCHFDQCNFMQSSLQRVQYQNGDAITTQWVSCQLRESHFTNFFLESCLFQGCAAPRVSMENVKMKGVIMREVEITRGTFCHISAINSVFSAVHESGVTGIRKSVISDSLFINCRFIGSILAFSKLENCLFLGCSFVNFDWNLTEQDNSAFFDCYGVQTVKNTDLDKTVFKGDWNRYEQEVLCG
jgi:uncharacterized protein YjbI with pentapeptide repeats